MSGTRRRAVLIALAVAAVVLSQRPFTVRAANGGTNDYYTSDVAGTSPDWWVPLSSPTAFASSYTTNRYSFPGQYWNNCGPQLGPGTDYFTEPPTGGTHGQPNVFGCGPTNNPSQWGPNRPGPFVGDVNDGASQLVAQGGNTMPWMGDGNPQLNTTPSTTDQAFNVWFRPEVAQMSGTEMVFTSGAVTTDNGSGYSLIPGPSQFYVLSHDDFNTLCFGMWGASGGWEGFSTYPSVEHCVPYSRGNGNVWTLISIKYTGCASGQLTCTLALALNGKVVHTLTNTPPHSAAEENGPVLGGGSAGTGFAADWWGFGEWSSSHADDLWSTANSTDPTMPAQLGAMYHGAGTGNGPTNTYIPPQLPGAAGSALGGCPSGQSLGPLSGECKFQIGHVGTTNCAAQSAGHNWWDVGADVTTALCYLGNVLIGALNGIIDGLNILVDLALPGAAFFQPIVQLKDTLLTHEPFSFVADALSGISNALTASPQGFTLHLGSPQALDITGSLSVLDPYRAPMVAVIWLGALVGIMRNARGDLGGEEAA